MKETEDRDKKRYDVILVDLWSFSRILQTILFKVLLEFTKYQSTEAHMLSVLCEKKLSYY